MPKVNAINCSVPEESLPSGWIAAGFIAAEISDRARYRGHCYFHAGAVQKPRTSAVEVTARVTGNKTYSVIFVRLDLRLRRTRLYVSRLLAHLLNKLALPWR